ncbi:MAG: hypothetical protein R3C30_02700 [Hyphomonadaceae bacterium]
MLKVSHALFAAASVLALSVGGAQAQSYEAQINPNATFEQAPTPTAPPRYIVRATTLYANDETGPDWAGSDEIYAEFELRTPDRVGGDAFYARTTTFQDFDTGETKRFREGENCLTSAVPAPGARITNSRVRFWDCHPNGDRYNLTFVVRLYEEDTGDDDLIGEREIRWTPAELDALNLGVGQKFPEHIRIGGYTLNWEIERVR